MSHPAETNCAYCGKHHDVAANLKGSGAPQDGDPTICGACGHWNVFDRKMPGGLRKATEQELERWQRSATPKRDTKRIRWIDRECEPQWPADPAFPAGVDIDMSRGAKHACTVTLPYPARRCGLYIIECDCGHQIAVTTAGRADDPRSLRLACKRRVRN